MGREYQISADGPDVVMTAISVPAEPQRFVRGAVDRWRGVDGLTEGEDLTVLRDDEGVVQRIDIATFLFARDPAQLG